MINVTLCFRGIIDNVDYQVDVKVYDGCKLICSGRTKCGKITFCLGINKAYRLEARLLGSCINTSFYVSDYNRCFYFSFNCFYQRNIIFLLRDYYYNLPIMKGELLLWQK